LPIFTFGSIGIELISVRMNQAVLKEEVEVVELKLVAGYYLQ
jgi:hypothetical protein